MNPENLKSTPLKSIHVAHKAKMVPFAGWEMPIHYGSQLNEHHMVRQTVGLFDVSHMGIVRITGPQSSDLLRYLLANDVAKLSNGRALYSCMLNTDGGVIDDVIVYRHQNDVYTVIVNAATTEKDIEWIRQIAQKFDCQVQLQEGWAMVALQGPQALSRFGEIFPEVAHDVLNCRPFGFVEPQLQGHNCLLARTGYTGEDGLEIMMPFNGMVALVTKLTEKGVGLCGLGARDTLRLEAGMPLYGQEMDEQVTPIEAGLGWTVDGSDSAREFIGKGALESRTPRFQTKGLIATEKQGIFRGQQTVYAASGQGKLTSGGFSPTIGRSIAMARLPLDVALGDVVTVDIRGQMVPAKVVACSMVRHGTIKVVW